MAPGHCALVVVEVVVVAKDHLVRGVLVRVRVRVRVRARARVRVRVRVS